MLNLDLFKLLCGNFSKIIKPSPHTDTLTKKKRYKKYRRDKVWTIITYANTSIT